MDEKIGDRVNALNTARYRTRQKQDKLRDLQMQYKQLAGKDAAEETRGSSGSSRANSGNGRSPSGNGTRSDGDGPNNSSNEKEANENDEGQVRACVCVCARVCADF